LTISSLAGGAIYLINKKLTDHSPDASAFTLTTSFGSALLSLPLLLFVQNFSLNSFTAFLVIVSTGTYGLSKFFSFKAYQYTDASLVSIIHKLNLVIVALLGVIFLKESYSTIKIIGLILITLSNIVIFWRGSKFDLNKGFVFALLMAIIGAIPAVMDKMILNNLSPYAYVFINSFIVGIMFSFIPGIWPRAVKVMKQNGQLVTFSSLLTTISWALFLIVLQKTAISTMYPIYKGIQLIVPVGLGILWLKETSMIKQKIVGTFISLVGILLLNY
jgi:uncharacterized membrane protein